MSDEQSLYIARPADIEALRGHWSKALDGASTFLRLQAPFGGGRRAMVSEFLREVEAKHDDVIIWRVQCLDQENGIQWMVRMYGALMATLTSDVLRRGKIEMVLNAQLPNQPARVQNWYQQFIQALKEAKTDREKGQVQLKLPQDNPLVGLVEVVAAISRKIPIVLELQNPYSVHSLAMSCFLDGLINETRSGSQLLAVIFDEPETDITKGMFPMPLLDLYERRSEAFTVQQVQPWGTDEVQAYCTSKGIEADAARIAEITAGRPGFIAELTEILQERDMLGGDLSEVTLASLLPLEVDEDELDEPEEPPAEGEPKHAGPDDLAAIAYFAALLGQAFPSGLVADMGGYDRESVDDLIDAAGDLFEEVQFAEDLGTWIYKFTRGSWREGVLELNDTEEGHEQARQVGLYMERFLVPRGYGFIAKTARVYAEHNAFERAGVMRSVALSNDANDVWGLCYDLTKYFDDVDWPDTLKRTIYMNLVEKLVAGGQVQTAERVHADVSAWATENDDRDLTAWLLLAGSRLDLRRQDLYRARDRANDALKLFTALENGARIAEVHNHLASLELQDGNPNAALENVNAALKAAQVELPDGQVGVAPAIFAQAEHIRGVVLRRSGKPKDAVEHFRRANEAAGQVGMGQLALDAGLAMGESLLASGDIQRSRDVLGRVLQIAQSLRDAARERATCELLAQCEGALKNYDSALQLAGRTLQLSQQLKFEHVLPIDYYNLGFFHYVTDKPSEALAFFKQSEQRIGALGQQHPVVKELFFYMGMASLRTGNRDDAKKSLQQALRPIQDAADWPKMVASLDNLAEIEKAEGNADVARKLLADAIGFAKRGNLREERKSLKKKLQGFA